MVITAHEKPSKKKIFQTLGLSAGFFLFVFALLFGILVLNQRYTKDYRIDEHGVVDMSAWNFERRGMNFLASGWSFYPDVLLEPSDFVTAGNGSSDDSAASLPPHFSSFSLNAIGWGIPGPDAVWSDPQRSIPDPGSYHVGTYRMTVKVSKRYPSLTVDFPEVNQAAKIFVNGKLVENHGTVSDDREVYVSDTSPVVLPVSPDESGEIEIIVQNASFNSPYAGITSAPGIGTQDQITFLTIVSRMWLTSIFTLLFLIVIIGFYVSFTFENRNKYYFFILLIFTAISFDFFDRSYNPLPENWNFILQVTMYLIMAIFSVMYFTSLFPKNLSAVFDRLNRVDQYVIIIALASFIGYTWLRQDDFSGTLPVWMIAIFVCAVHLYLLAKVLYSAIKSKSYGAFYVVSAIMGTMVFSTMLMRAQLIFYIPLHSVCIMMLILGTVLYFTVQYVGTNNQVSRFTLELEIAVQEKTRNIAKVNAELLLANKRLLENEDARKKMMSNVSHDLRTPITAIRGYIELLLRAGCNLPEETHETYLRNMHTRCMQMEQLIEDLMQLTRLESGEVIGEMEVLSLSEIIGSLCDLYASESSHDGKSIQMNLPENDDLFVKGDPNNLLRVFDNLLVNAMRYTGENAVIVISATREVDPSLGPVIHISVSDNGCGIPESEIPYVFDRFYRASNSSIMKNGTGLGLAIVKSIVKKHKGSVWVDSKENEGSVFHVLLPSVSDEESKAWTVPSES